MNYNLLERNQSLSIQEQVLKNRGIDNYDEYLNAGKDDIIHWSKLDNIQEAVECLQNAIVNGLRIGLIADSDADGSLSSGMFYNYFKKYNPFVYFHESKEHGLSDYLMPQIISDIEHKEIGILVIPDAQAAEDNCKKLKQLGIDIITLDHHDTEKYNPYAILVNPMLSKGYENKFLSGAGVTWKFLQCYSDMNGNYDADRYVDMVAYSIMSDSMNIKTLENRAIITLGMNNTNNKMLLEFIKGVEQPDKEETSFSRKVETPTDVSFNVVPLINGLIRVGSQEDKQLMFNAFAEVEQDYEYTNPKTKQEGFETVYRRTFRICKNAKTRQDKEVAKAMDIVKEDIVKNKRDNHKILFCKINADVDKSFSGLCAIKIASEFNKPTVLLREGKNDYFSGSIRNFDGSPLKDLKGFLQSFGYTSFIAGHANSAGIGLTKKQLLKLIELTDEKLKNYSFDKNYDIDFEFDGIDNLMSNSEFTELYNLRFYYGQGIQKSYTLLKNIEFNSSSIKFLGKEKDTWKVSLKNNLDIIKFKANNNDPIYEKFCDKNDFSWANQDVSINMVGSLGLNEWGGKKVWQYIVESYEENEIIESKNVESINDFEW